MTLCDNGSHQIYHVSRTEIWESSFFAHSVQKLRNRLLPRYIAIIAPPIPPEVTIPRPNVVSKKFQHQSITTQPTPMPATLKISPPRPPRSPPPQRPKTPSPPQPPNHSTSSRFSEPHRSSTHSTDQPFHHLNPIPEPDAAPTPTSPPSTDEFLNTLLSALDLDVTAPWPLQLHTELSSAISRVQLEGQRRRERRPWRVGGLRIWEVLGVSRYLDEKSLRVEEGAECVQGSSRGDDEGGGYVDEREERTERRLGRSGVNWRGADVEKEKKTSDFSIRAEEDGMQGRALQYQDPELILQRSNVSAKRSDPEIHIPGRRNISARNTSSRYASTKQDQIAHMQNQPLERTHNSARNAVREPRMERGTASRMNTSRRVAALQNNKDPRRERHRSRSLERLGEPSARHYRHHTHRHTHRHRRPAPSLLPHYPSTNPNAHADTRATRSSSTATQRFDPRGRRSGMGRRRASRIAVRTGERRQRQRQQRDSNRSLKSSTAKVLDTLSTVTDWRYVRGPSI